MQFNAIEPALTSFTPISQTSHGAMTRGILVFADWNMGGIEMADNRWFTSTVDLEETQ